MLTIIFPAVIFCAPLVVWEILEANSLKIIEIDALRKNLFAHLLFSA